MSIQEGNLQAPTRHALDWKNPLFYDRDDANKEMERVFDICHGCRRCVSLCQSFPTLFDLSMPPPTVRCTASKRKPIGTWWISVICATCVS